MIVFYSFCIGLLGSGFVAFLAYISNALTLSGSLALLLVGATVFAFAPSGTWLLLLFFFGSSLLIHFFRRIVQKQSKIPIETLRQATQVFANSLPFLIASLAYFVTGEFYWLIACGSTIAGATADTWSSEIGVLSRKAPRNILDFRQETTGSSGAISILGLLAAIIASFLTASVFYLLLTLFHDPITPGYFLVPFFSGIVATLFDSFLGAALQGKFLCQICGKKIEKRSHHDQPTILIHGLRFLDNDGVNFLSGLLTLLLSISLSLWFIR